MRKYEVKLLFHNIINILLVIASITIFFLPVCSLSKTEEILGTEATVKISASPFDLLIDNAERTYSFSLDSNELADTENTEDKIDIFKAATQAINIENTVVARYVWLVLILGFNFFWLIILFYTIKGFRSSLKSPSTIANLYILKYYEITKTLSSALSVLFTNIVLIFPIYIYVVRFFIFASNDFNIDFAFDVDIIFPLIWCILTWLIGVLNRKGYKSDIDAIYELGDYFDYRPLIRFTEKDDNLAKQTQNMLSEIEKNSKTDNEDE